MKQKAQVTKKVNAYLAVDAEIKRLEKERNELRDALLGTGMEYFEGKEGALKVTETVRWNLKTKEVKEEMGEDWWAKRCATALVTSLRIAKKGI